MDTGNQRLFAGAGCSDAGFFRFYGSLVVFPWPSLFHSPVPAFPGHVQHPFVNYDWQNSRSRYPNRPVGTGRMDFGLWVFGPILLEKIQKEDDR